MTDHEKLEKAIENSGLKLGYISTYLGISNEAFRNKRKGKSQFTVAEINKLCNVLGISKKDRESIFFI